MTRKLIIAACVLLIVCVISVLSFAPRLVDSNQNQVEQHTPYVISERAKLLHETLIVGDWHADTTLWSRDLSKRNSIGHMDLPRMREGNVAIQMFTTVTKSPSGLNYDGSIDAIFDASEMPALTQALLDEGVSEADIRQVMGGNMLAFLLANLPAT